MTTTTITDTDIDAATCRDCSSTEDVIDGLCEECSQNYEWCAVCHKDVSRDGNYCRHLSWTDGIGHVGAGTYEGDWDYCRESFHALLDLLAMIPQCATRDADERGWLGWRDRDDGAADDLVTEIERWLVRDNFWTFLHGSMFGTPDCDFRHERRKSDGWCPPFAELNSSWVNVWLSECPEKYEAAADGFKWLTTLESQKTKAANARTVRWIMEWRLGREAARRVTDTEGRP